MSTYSDIQGRLLSSVTGKQWKKIGVSAHHGINLPLASIHSKHSCGIGEFHDLIPLIDWCKKVGFDVIQLLPLNDSGSDPSPYNALSSCALHPIYLSLSDLPFVKEDEVLQESILQMQNLNHLEHTPYNEILNRKMTFLRIYYEKHKAHWLNSVDYKTFASNWKWLEPYSLFKTLQKNLKADQFSLWPEEIKRPSDKTYKKMTHLHSDDISFYTLLQYLSFKQFSSTCSYAKKQGILIKGDIPILISAESADVWHEPHLFKLVLRAGAPPDQYNPDGQYWGFPLFNWPMIEKHHFSWWRQRLEYASLYYDLFRLDHVIGFFRIWAIAEGADAKDGQYVPHNKEGWGPQGQRILEKLISFSQMLPIAEDLGTVPECVPPILTEMGVCGTKVMRWERYWNRDGHYIPLNRYPYVSMTTVSTHDSHTLTQWWRDFPDEARFFCLEKGWDYEPILALQYREKILRDSHHTSSLFHINLIQEYLNLYKELSWENPDQERINIPGKVLDTNWTYKIKQPVEQIVEHHDLQKSISRILLKS